MHRLTRWTLAAAAAAGGLMAAPAMAATIYTLNVQNGALPGAPPYGSVSVSLNDATHAQIVFTSNTAAGYFFLGNSSAAVNANGTATTGSITGNAGAGGPCPAGGAACYSDDGSQNVGMFGVMSNTIDTTDGFTNRSSTISFILTLTSGSWASDALVLANNANNFLAAAHIGQCGSPTNCTSFIATGFAGNGPGTVVPEPISLALFGTGLLALGGCARRSARRV